MAEALDMQGLKDRDPEGQMVIPETRWTFTRSLVVAVVAVAALTLTLGVAQTASAQSPEEVDAKRLSDCRLATQVLTFGQPATKWEWAVQRIGACGSEGASALATAVRNARTSTDTLHLQQLTDAALYLHHLDLYDASLTIAGDVSASIPARVFAFRTLINHLEPTLWFRRLEDMAPPVRDGIRRCDPEMHGHSSAADAAALPATARTDILAVAGRVAADASVPDRVRTAAYCAALFVRQGS